MIPNKQTNNTTNTKNTKYTHSHKVTRSLVSSDLSESAWAGLFRWRALSFVTLSISFQLLTASTGPSPLNHQCLQ